MSELADAIAASVFMICVTACWVAWLKYRGKR